jgi:hypothetical protein
MMLRFLVFVCFFCGVAVSFRPVPGLLTRRGDLGTNNRVLHANNNKEGGDGGGFNLFQGVSNMFAEMDSQMDDFFNKRMGNGEVFYGKRKFQPSGRENTEGEYNGMGMSDPIRIAMAKAKKEAMLEQRQRRLEKAEQEKQQKRR